MIKILGRITSINVRKVTWTLDELGVPFEREDWGVPFRDPHLPEFLALNPNAQVPVVIDDGFVLWESSAIIRYLAGKANSELWPVDSRERARVDQWVTWQATELNPSWGYAVYALLRRDPAFSDVALIDKSVRAWTAKMQLLDDQMAAADGMVVNGRFSLADIVLALSTHRWMSTPFDKPTLPAVEKHYAKMRSRPAGEAYMGANTP